MKLDPSTLPEHIKRLNPHLTIGRIELPQDKPEPSKRDKPPRRIKQDSKPLLNELEADFFVWLKRNNPDAFIYSQAMRFRLGNGIWYKPDLIMFNPFTGRTIAIEVKGPHAFRGGFENLKVAAGLYQHIVWQLAWREDGGWMFQTVLA